MSLVQIKAHKGRIMRVKAGEEPVIELDLEPHQEILCAELREVPDHGGLRVTRDFVWKVMVATRL